MVSARAGGSRIYATDAEVLELLELTHRRDNPSTRLYKSKVNNRRNVYRWVVGRDAGRQAGRDGWIFCSWSQIGHDLYDDVEVNNPADGQRKSASLRRMLRDLERAQLLEWAPRTDERGKFLGVMVRLLPVPSHQVASPAELLRPGGKCAGRWQRVRETREQRRAACARGRHRRIGHGSRPLFFRTRDLTSPPSGEPMGFAHGAPSHGCARARGRDASDAGATSSRAQANGGGEREGSAAERRAQRAERRHRARIDRWQAETRRQLADGELMHRNELESYRAAAGDRDAELELFGRFAAFLAPTPGRGGGE
jgi:hypothetical protein